MDCSARVTAWAKGFRVSQTSQEFQLVVPASERALERIEHVLPDQDWPGVIERLYRTDPALLSVQFALVFNDSEAVHVAVAPSKDHINRQSIVAVTVAAAIDWQAPELAVQLGKMRALARRLALSYARVLSGGSAQVREQLRSGAFLADRTFQLALERADAETDWSQLVGEIRRWKGIAGVATAPLCPFGANVLYGTRIDFDAYSGQDLAGFFDVARGQIEPLSAGLTPWRDEPSKTPQEPAAVSRGDANQLHEINENLRQMNRRFDAFYELFVASFDRLLAIFLPTGPTERERRKRESK